MFWNKQNANQNQNNETKNGKKNWLHAPDALVNGHVAYLVKVSVVVVDVFFLFLHDNVSAGYKVK